MACADIAFCIKLFNRTRAVGGEDQHEKEGERKYVVAGDKTQSGHRAGDGMMGRAKRETPFILPQLLPVKIDATRKTARPAGGQHVTWPSK